MIDDMGDFTGFASDVKLIYSGEFTIKVAKTEENVTDNYLSSDDVINVYISGIDSRGGINEVSRSDVNIIMSVNKKTHNILMINTPRDYYVSGFLYPILSGISLHMQVFMELSVPEILWRCFMVSRLIIM